MSKTSTSIERICIGYSEGELLPPYNLGIFYDLERISNIHSELKRSPEIKKYKLLIRALEDMDRSSSDIEIIGSWATICIPEAIGYALSRSRIVKTNMDLIVFPEKIDKDNRPLILKKKVEGCYMYWSSLNPTPQKTYDISRSGSSLIFSVV